VSLKFVTLRDDKFRFDLHRVPFHPSTLTYIINFDTLRFELCCNLYFNFDIAAKTLLDTGFETTISLGICKPDMLAAAFSSL
jgi:hypothetical protein